MKADAILPLLTVLLTGPDTTAFSTLTSGGADARYPVTISECSRPIPVADIEGRTIICGSVNVPENHGAPDGNRIDLKFALLKSRSEAPAADPVVYLEGGPGGSALADLQFNGDNFSFIRDRRDLIMFDQRAAGLSASSITCFNNLADSIYQLAGVEKSPDDDDEKGPVATCLDEVAAKGVVVADYNTTQNAYDVRAVMSALGYPTYNALGISYGTTLGQELLRADPQGLRSIILDSIDPLDEKSYDNNGVPLDEAIGAVVDQCAADAACAKAFPTLEADINAAAKALAATPIPATSARPAIDLTTMIKLFDNRDYFGLTPGITAYIPRIITEWTKGVSTTYDAVSGPALTRQATPEQLLTPYIGKLSPERLAIAYSIAQQAAALKQAEAAVDTLIYRLSGESALPADLSDLPGLLDTALSAAIPDTDPKVLYEMGKDYARFLGAPGDRAGLTAWLQKYVPEPHLQRTLELVHVMSDADVAAFFKQASADIGKYFGTVTGDIDLAVYACQESVPFNSLEGLKAVAKTYRFAFLEDYTVQDTSGFFNLCEGVTPHPREGFHTPVASDLPVLALSGLNDTQTSPDAAEHLKSFPLTRLQALTVPEAGHGVVLFSQCAKDIAVAFFERPEEPVNSACVATLAPKFSVPASQ